jgi:VanZ family protein
MLNQLMVSQKNRLKPSWFLFATCLAMTIGLLAVGLWPFDPFPENDVTWAAAGKGLEFGDHGIVFSSLPLKTLQRSAPQFCALQIQLQPKIVHLNNSGTILVFYTPQNPSQFTLMQYRDELLIRKARPKGTSGFTTVELELEHAFTSDEPVLFTITSGPDTTVAYRNGVRVGNSTRLGLSCEDMSGQLVLGNSPVSDNPWRGTLFGLAIYDSPVTPATTTDDPANLIARYGFSEGLGKIVHNNAGSAPNLEIPASFQILHKGFLIPPWDEPPDKVDARDILINILGFMPFGFLAFGYVQWQRNWNHAAILTVLSGALISLTIEVLQAFVPSRASGVLDIVTNTFGTFLGVLVFRWSAAQSLAVRLRLFHLPTNRAGQD